jgi:hypothetical protein
MATRNKEPILQGILGKGNSLTELRLEICHSFLFSWGSQFRYASNLQVLYLGLCHTTGDIESALLAGHFANLRLVGLDSCSCMDDLLVESFAVNSPRLEGIHLSKRMIPTTAVSDRLKAIATHCCNLQELQLECCRSVTADSLVLLVSSLPRVRELALHDLSTVTDMVVVAIGGHATCLTVLRLYESKGYSRVGSTLLGLRCLRATAVWHRPQSL